MLKQIKAFFFPLQSIYLYDVSKELVIERINDFFHRERSLFDSNNLLGEFINKDSFEIWMKSAAYKTGLVGQSRMTGEIKEVQNGSTEILLKAKPNKGLYLMFFVFMVFGLIYLFNGIQTGSLKFLLFSGLMLIGGPIVCIGISSVQIQAIKDNYLKYIDRIIKAI